MILHYPDASPAPFAPVALTFRHWRVLWLSTYSNTYAAMAEAEFRQVLNTPEQATGGVASASSVYGGGFDALNAFDNNPATAWNGAINDVTNAWLRYSFAAPIMPVQLLLRAGPSAAYATHAPTQFQLQYSADGMAWNTKYNSAPITWVSGEAKAFNL